MRTIKRISHLRSEQRRLRQREADMEKAIREDWQSIRHGLHPAGVAREVLSSCAVRIGRQLLSRTS